MYNDRFRSYLTDYPIPIPPQSWTWNDLMSEAIKEAYLAFNEEEVPVGAIIVNKKGNIISRAHNLTIQSYNPCAHAELIAIEKAAKKLSTSKLNDCIMIVTLEPCLMCASAIAISAIKGIVFGALDTKAGAIISTNEFINLPINSKHIWYMGGIAANTCKKILEDFFKKLRN